MKITYGIVDEFYTVGNSSRRSYGIAAYSIAAQNDCTTVVCAVHDISTDRSALSELVETCNALELSPMHLCDVIEDFIAH